MAWQELTIDGKKAFLHGSGGMQMFQKDEIARVVVKVFSDEHLLLMIELRKARQRPIMIYGHVADLREKLDSLAQVYPVVQSGTGPE
jgi:hypothetical protein